MNRLIILTDEQAQILEGAINGLIADFNKDFETGKAKEYEPEVRHHVRVLEQIFDEVKGASVSDLATLRQENHDLRNKIQALTIEKQLKDRKG